MSERFADLRKVPKAPATRLLASANLRLESELGLPANASVSDVMEGLEAQEDRIAGALDQLRLMAASLPARELAWWACLAGRDLLGPDPKAQSGCLTATEAWVRKPSDETRKAVRAAVEIAEPDDDASLAATCALFCDGKLGPEEFAEYDAPPGVAAGAAFGMNVSALMMAGDGIEAAAAHLVDRALDLARGGNGSPVGLWEFLPEEPEDPPEEEEIEDEEEEALI